MALLALVSDFAKIVPRAVIVHYCHHGVISAADDWLSFVATEAKRRDFGFKAHRLALEMGPDFEARARKARYDSVMSDVQSGDVVMTAHHRDDQVETLLIRLSQGSGLIGLAGIPVMRPFGLGALDSSSVVVIAKAIEASLGVQKPSAHHRPLQSRFRVFTQLHPPSIFACVIPCCASNARATAVVIKTCHRPCFSSRRNSR